MCIKFDCLFNFNYFISDADEDLKRRVETSSYVHNKCVIMFNTVFLLLSTYIDWENYQTSKNESSDEHQFINCIRDIYWYQNVNSPTRYREATEPSTLDLILTNE